MSETRQPPPLEQGFDNDFDKELIQMWQANTCSLPDDSGELTRLFAGWVEKFDRRLLWRNVVEYAAGAVVLIRSAFDIASGDRLLIAPLTSAGAVLFILTYLWRKSRITQPLDAAADASAYRTALLQRLDRQIRLARSVRYWYVLPCWFFFLTVLGSGVFKLITRPAERYSTGFLFVALVAEFLLATAFCVVVVWLNEYYGVRKLKAERERVKAIVTESGEGE